MIVRSSLGTPVEMPSRSMDPSRTSRMRRGRGLARILVALGGGALTTLATLATLATLEAPAEAAELRIVMQTNTPSPVADYRYTDVGYVTMGETGDIAYVARIRKDNDEKRSLFRESGPTVAPVAVPGTPRPGGGTWAALDITPLLFRGQWLFFQTKDPAAGTALFVRGSLEASTQPVIAEADADGAATVGPVATFAANANRSVVAQTPNAFFSVHPNNGRKRLLAYMEEIPGATGQFAQTFDRSFVDDADNYTCVSSGYVLHGPATGLAPIPWFVSNPGNGNILDVGQKGGIVAMGFVPPGTTVKAVYVGGPAGLVEAFRYGDGVTVAGKPITTVDQVRAISTTSFAFIGRETNLTSHAMLFEGGQVKEIAGPGIDAPGTGQKFTGVRDIGVNGKGQIVLRANFEKESTTGIFLHSPGTGMEYIAGRGTKVGEMDIGSVDVIDSSNIDENGRVGFVAMHVSQNVTAVIATGAAGKPPPADSADLELTAEQVEGEIVFHVKNLGPASAKSATLTIRGHELELAPDQKFLKCDPVNGDTVCSILPPGFGIGVGNDEDVRLLPPAVAGSRVEGFVSGPSDQNLANNTASVIYEPKDLAKDPIQQTRDSCGIAGGAGGSRWGTERGAPFAPLLVLAAALRHRRRAALRR